MSVIVCAVLTAGSAWHETARAATGDTTLVFVRGADNGVWYRAFDHDSGAWQSWRTLGGGVTGVPKSELMPDGRIAVFARGLDGAVWTRSTFDLATWSPWASLGGYLTDDPAIVFTPWSTDGDEPDVVVVGWGGDHQAWATGYAGNTGRWIGWRRISAVPGVGRMEAWADPETGSIFVTQAQPPTLVPNLKYFFAEGFDAALGRSQSFPIGRGEPGSEMPTTGGAPDPFVAVTRRANGSLTSVDRVTGIWVDRGGVLWDGPTFGPWVGDDITVLGQGADRAVWWWGSGGWSTLGGTVLESPTGQYIDDTRFLMTARGLDHAVWTRTWDESTKSWAGWSTLGGIATSEPSQLTVLTSED